MMIQGEILLKPFEMNHTKRSKLVFENDANYGTFLIPVNGIPNSECKLLENVYHGDASVFKPHKNSEAEEKEPTILIIKDEDTHREISLFPARTTSDLRESHYWNRSV